MLIGALMKNDVLCELHLKECKLDSMAAMMFADMLGNNTTLTQLSLSGNDISTEQLAGLAELLVVNQEDVEEEKRNDAQNEQEQDEQEQDEQEQEEDVSDECDDESSEDNVIREANIHERDVNPGLIARGLLAIGTSQGIHLFFGSVISTVTYTYTLTLSFLFNLYDSIFLHFRSFFIFLGSFLLADDTESNSVSPTLNLQILSTDAVADHSSSINY